MGFNVFLTFSHKRRNKSGKILKGMKNSEGTPCGREGPRAEKKKKSFQDFEKPLGNAQG